MNAKAGIARQVFAVNSSEQLSFPSFQFPRIPSSARSVGQLEQLTGGSIIFDAADNLQMRHGSALSCVQGDLLACSPLWEGIIMLAAHAHNAQLCTAECTAKGS